MRDLEPEPEDTKIDRQHHSYRLTLRNDQHDTIYTIHLGKALPSTIGPFQAVRCRRALCGLGAFCEEYGILGESGPQDLPLNISENPDGSVSIRRS